MPLDPIAMKAGARIIWFGAMFIIFSHLIRKKVKNLYLVAPLLCFLSYLATEPISLVVLRVNFLAEILSLLLANATGVAVGMVILLALLGFAWKLSAALPSQEYRSLSHALGGLVLVYFMFVDVNISFLLWSAWTVAFLMGEYLKLSYLSGRHAGKFSRFAHRLISSAVRRKTESKFFMPTYSALLGILIALVFLPHQFALASILVLSTSDPGASMVGRRIGRTRWPHNPKKSLEGSGTFLGIALLVLFALDIAPWVAIAAAISVMLFESLDLEVSDNLVIPLITGMVLVGSV